MTEPTITPDPALAAALRRTEPEPPLHEVDWDAMRARLNARAELPLARLRTAARTDAPSAEIPAIPLAPTRTRRAGHRTLQWLVPLAAAAGLGGLMLAHPGHVADGTGREGPPAAVSQPAGADVQAVLDATIPDGVDLAIDGSQADEDAVLTGALGS